MGFIFLIFVVIVCWILYLIVQWTKSVNPSKDGTMLYVSQKADYGVSKSSSIRSEEVDETQVENLEIDKFKTEVEKVEVDDELECDLKTEVEKVIAEIELKADSEINQIEISEVELNKLEAEVVETGVEKNMAEVDLEAGVDVEKIEGIEVEVKKVDDLERDLKTQVEKVIAEIELKADAEMDKEETSKVEAEKVEVDKIETDVVEADVEKVIANEELKTGAEVGRIESTEVTVDKLETEAVETDVEKVIYEVELLADDELEKIDTTEVEAENVKVDRPESDFVETKVEKGTDEVELKVGVEVEEIASTEVEVEKVDVDNLESHVKTKVETGVAEVELEAGVKIEKVETTELEKEEERKVNEEEADDNGRKEENIDKDFLSYNEDVSEDEFDFRVAEILIKANEMDIAQESICEEMKKDSKPSGENIEVSERGDEDLLSSKQTPVVEDLKFDIEFQDKENFMSKEDKEDSFVQILKDMDETETVKGIKEAIKLLEYEEEIFKTSEGSNDEVKFTETSEEQNKENKERKIEEQNYTTTEDNSVMKEAMGEILDDTNDIKDGGEEVKNLEEEGKEIKILKDLNETETSESKKETIIFEENKDNAIKRQEEGYHITTDVDKHGDTDTFTGEIEEDRDNSILKDTQIENEKFKENNESKSLEEELLSKFKEIHTTDVKDTKSTNQNLSFTSQENFHSSHSSETENIGNTNAVNKTVIITHEGDFVSNYNEEIQISEVMETELVHQQKIEYTEIAGEEEVLYRNVTKRGEEEFVEEFQTKNEIFNEKSCTSSVVTNEEVSSTEQTTSTIITKVINLSYTTEECSTENVEIRTIIGDTEAFMPLADNEQYSKLDTDSIKERITLSKAGNVNQSVTDTTLKESFSTTESVGVENVSNDGAKEFKKPVGGVLLFGGEELLNKIKSRKLIVDGYEKEQQQKFENGDEWRLSKINKDIDECQLNIVTSKTTSFPTASSSSSTTSTKTTSMTSQMRNQKTQMKQDIKQINLSSLNAFEKPDATIPVLSENLGHPTNNEGSSATHFSESQFEDGFKMTSHNGSEGEIISEIPTFQTESPLIHLNKDRNKGPVRRRKPEKSNEGI